MEVWLGARCSYRLLIVQENCFEGTGPLWWRTIDNRQLEMLLLLVYTPGQFLKIQYDCHMTFNERHFHFDCCQLLNSYFHRKKQQNSCSSQNFTWNEIWYLEESSRSFKSLIFRIIWEQIKRKDFQDLLVIMYFF